MKREPSVSHRWWTKWFFPRLLATEAYRYIFRNSKRRISPATAQNITHALSLLYVLTAGTAAGIAYYVYYYSEKPNEGESTASFYARMCAKNVEDEQHKIYRVKVLDGFKKEDITDEVRKSAFGQREENYDRYSDPAYIRKRLNVPEGSSKDESFDIELASHYLRRMDKMNKIK